MEGLWGAKGHPDTPKLARPGSTGRGRGGVNPSPEGRGVLGRRILGKRVPLNHLSPRGLVGFPGGFSCKTQLLRELSKKFGVPGVADFQSIAEIE